MQHYKLTSFNKNEEKVQFQQRGEEVLSSAEASAMEELHHKTAQLGNIRRFNTLNYINSLNGCFVLLKFVFMFELIVPLVLFLIMFAIRQKQHAKPINTGD